jgi:osmotically-inducible protein OsmY
MKSDARLRRDIEDELLAEPSVDSAAIGVAAKDGIVTLSGHVASYAEKVAAERAASRVLGVKAVVTELDVKLPDSDQVTDESIAQAAVDALSWNALVPKDRIHVQVSSGWVALEGEVDWHYQKAAAHNAVSALKGVTGVSDQVVVKPSSVREEVKAHIESALRRTFGRRTRRITVETRRDHVMLWGAVNSLAERAEAERAAWTTPGVCHVDNHLEVSDSRARARRERAPS